MRQALTHRSYAQEQSVSSNERLEFVGDAVLDMVISEYLFRSFPKVEEGRMSKIRAAVVNMDRLGQVAADYGVGTLVRLGAAEQEAGGREKVSILADALEAIIGALYLEDGLNSASRLILMLLEPYILAAVDDRVLGDFKSALQEWLAIRSLPPPIYVDSWEGPDHDRLFVTEMRLRDGRSFVGMGRSKKQAQQDAARRFLVEETDRAES
jgi:ribonuclease-3